MGERSGLRGRLARGHAPRRRRRDGPRRHPPAMRVALGESRGGNPRPDHDRCGRGNGAMLKQLLETSNVVSYLPMGFN